SDEARRAGSDAHHAAGERLGLSFRSPDQRHRRAYFATAFQDRQGFRTTIAAHDPRRGIHDTRRDTVTAFGKLIRTTAFRLTLVYLFLFALFAASLLGYFAWNTRRMITEQITTTVSAEVSEITDIYDRRGLQRLFFAIESRALRPGANLYLVTTPTGQAIAGNVGSLAPGVMGTTGWSETAYRRLDEGDNAYHRALVNVTQLSGGFRLLIGRDLEERRRLFGI